MIESPTSRPHWKDWFGLVARLVTGGVMIYAGASKITNLEASVLAVRGYQLGFIPYEVQKVIGYALPVVEILIGILLLVGLFTRLAAVSVTALLVAFIAGIASAWARGLSIDCGCFGGGGETDSPEYLKRIVEDSVWALLGLWLVIRPRTPFSVDNWLFRPLSPTPVDDTLDDDSDDIDLDDNLREESPR